MWLRYLKPRSADLVMHTAETRMIQRVLAQVEKQEKLAPQTLATSNTCSVVHSTSPLKQGHLPKDTSNLVTCAETSL